MKQKNIKFYSLSALFSALLCISAWIFIPTLVPFTIQTLVVAMAGVLLGAKYGTLSVLTYLLLGVLGLPVFAGFNSGFGVLLGPTGGFSLGFLAFSAVTGLLSKNRTSFCQIVLSMTAGLLACYIIGSLWYLFIYLDTHQGIWAVLMTCVVPFIIPDIIKIFVGALLVMRLKKHIK